MKWIVEYVTGKVDDPQHGSMEVAAETVTEAIVAANKQGLNEREIVSVSLED